MRREYPVKLSSKGQVTIPMEVRSALGLKPGDSIEFIPAGDVVIIERVAGAATRRPQSPKR